jgi:carbonic anhydrase/acetyltransferase-like protein (isoleucine patch superfamily)
MSVYSLGDKSPKFPNEGDYWIAPGAHVLGQVELGKNVGIWFGSVLRGDNDLIKIGDETNIQENTIIHVDPGCPSNDRKKLYDWSQCYYSWLYYWK